MTADLLFAEELLLLALDAGMGKDRTDPGLAGAILLDLAEAGRIEARDERLVVVPGPTPRAPLLREALSVIEGDGKPRKARHWVERLPRRLEPFKDRAAARLIERGVLDRDESTVLGLFARTRYPERDPAPRGALRARVVGVLVEEAEADRRTALLIGLLRPTGLVDDLVPRKLRRAAQRRAEVAENGLVGSAVDRAVRDAQMAIVAASTAAFTATTAGSGGDGGGGGT